MEKRDQRGARIPEVKVGSAVDFGLCEQGTEH